MKKLSLSKPGITKRIMTALICLTALSLKEIKAQQFNSDSWLSKPHGTITIIPTLGERNSMLMNTYSLFPRWEFTMAAYLYNNDGDPTTNDGYSTSFYGKYMFYQNKDATGGAAIKAGTGTFPGTLDEEERVKDAFKTFWVNFPVTIPFRNNTFSLDLMPGASLTRHYGAEETNAYAFTYSTRLAWYPNTKWSIVGEVFGSAGKSGSLPEFKFGPRWEPSQYAVFALTYGNEFNGNNGAGFEFGVMLFTPPFACLAGCGGTGKKTKKKNKEGL